MRTMQIVVATVVLIVLGTVAWATRFEYIVMRVDPVSVIRVNRYTGQAHAYMPLDRWVQIKELPAMVKADSIYRGGDPYDLSSYNSHP